MRAKPLPLKQALALALGLAALDQLSKIAIVFWAGFATHETRHILPFLDFTLIWNHGISYGLFAEGGTAGRILLIGIALVAIGFFTYLMRGAEHFRARARSRLGGLNQGRRRHAAKREGEQKSDDRSGLVHRRPCSTAGRGARSHDRASETSSKYDASRTARGRPGSISSRSVRWATRPSPSGCFTQASS